MKRKSIIAVLALVLVLTLSLSIFSACNKKHKYSSEWKFDAKTHWHECTAKKHTDTTEKLPHEFKEEIVKEAGYGVVGTKKLTCKVCGYSYTQDIDAVDAKDNEIKLADGKMLDKTYDGKVVDTTDKFSFSGDGAVTVMFKVKGAEDDTYTADAPKNAGEYTVKVSVKATAEWKAATKTFDFEISKKELTGTATKVYDGNATMPATLTGVVEGETVTATITMTSKNVDATVQSVILEGADKDNYVIDKTKVTASITPMIISVEWEQPYNNSNIITDEPAELLAGDEALITVTMDSANVGATVQSFEITGKDAGNYSLARENVTVEIVKADIDFEISNASALTEFFVGATNIPDPTTDYEEIGTGYGEKTVVWEMQVSVEDNVWGPIVAGSSRVRERAGNYRVRIQYAKGDNYNFGATDYVYFTVKAKSRSLTVKNFTGKTYDGKPVENFTYEKLVDIVNISEIPGVTDITSPYDGEKYAEFRRKGEVLWTTVTDTYVPQNAAEYEYRIGIKATDEWEAVVSEVKTFTIKPYEFVLELGYGQNQNNQSFDSGKTFVLRTFNQANGNELIAGQKIELWLDNEKAGFQTREGNNSVYYFVPDQKKQVTIDCFFLKIANISNPVMENYKIVPKYSYISTVEITVVEHNPLAVGQSGSLTAVNFTVTETWLTTTVAKGYFKVGHTVEVYNNAGTKVGEATITKIEIETTDASSFSSSPSGFAIPSDGKVRITLDKVFKDSSTGGYIPLTGGYIKTK